MCAGDQVEEEQGWELWRWSQVVHHGIGVTLKERYMNKVA